MKIYEVIKSAVMDFFEDECMVSGASLAYYTIFSLPPLLVIVFSMAGWVGVKEAKIDRLVKQQLGIPITEVKENKEAAVQEKTSDSEQSGGIANVAGLGWLSKIVGIGILIFSATGLFAQMQHALNRAWEVEPDPEQSGVIGFLMKRFLSLGMVIVIAFLLLVSFVLTTLVDEAVRWIQGPEAGTAMMVIGIVLNNLITIFVATLLFAAMFKILPDAKTSWGDLFMGAAMTAVLFVIGKALIGWYLQNSQLGSSWGGAASSMVAILVWVYYSSLIVLLGAELAQVYASEYGKGIKPAKGAVRIVEEKHHVRGDTKRETANT